MRGINHSDFPAHLKVQSAKNWEFREEDLTACSNLVTARIDRITSFPCNTNNAWMRLVQAENDLKCRCDRLQPRAAHS